MFYSLSSTFMYGVVNYLSLYEPNHEPVKLFSIVRKIRDGPLKSIHRYFSCLNRKRKFFGWQNNIKRERMLVAKFKNHRSLYRFMQDDWNNSVKPIVPINTNEHNIELNPVIIGPSATKQIDKLLNSDLVI